MLARNTWGLLCCFSRSPSTPVMAHVRAWVPAGITLNVPQGSVPAPRGRMRCALCGTAGKTQHLAPTPLPMGGRRCAVHLCQEQGWHHTAVAQEHPLSSSTHTHPSTCFPALPLAGHTNKSPHRAPTAPASSLATTLPRHPRSSLEHPSLFANVVTEVEAPATEV